MKKLVLGAVAASLLVLGAPMASAAEVVEGGCGFSANDNAATQGFEGEIDVLLVGLEDSTTPPGLLDIAGDCWIEVDSIEATGTRLSFSGSGVVADAQQISFPAGETTQLCWDYTVGSQTFVDCTDPDVEAEFPPQEVQDLITELTSIPDFVLCPILATLAPGIPGVLDIDTEGDVTIAGIPFWDCPPYGS